MSILTGGAPGSERRGNLIQVAYLRLKSVEVLLVNSNKHSRKENVFVVSLGCPKNLCDTEVMMGELAEAGHKFVSDSGDATAVLINTCAFIEDATTESLDVINDYAELRRTGSLRLLVVAGCLPQRDPAALRDGFPEVDAWLGTGDLLSVAEAFADAGSGETYCKVNAPGFLPESETPRVRATSSHYAYLKIADGCSNCCSYCVIPSIRGPYRSRSIDAVMKDAGALVESGARELVLVAQDVTRFGEDRTDRSGLTDLLRRLEAIDELRWIRVMYAYPKRITDRFIDVMAGSSKIVNYLDMPIQHADPGMLRAMNRSDTPETMRATIDALRYAMPDITLRTSVMVGFPGETDHAFNSLLAFVKEIGFDRLGAFCYSAEEGTQAAVMDDQVHAETAAERLDAIMRTQQTISLEKHLALVGRRMQVLMDEPEVGRTYRDAPDIDGTVRVTGYDDVPGRFIEVEITGADVYDLDGRVIEGT